MTNDQPPAGERPVPRGGDGPPSVRGRDLIVGGMIGGLVGLVVAVNVVIYSGIEEGYEADLADVFGQRPIVGLLVLSILVVAPVVGVLAARRIRLERDRRDRADGT